MIEPGPSLAELAAEEFERRRATATRKVAGGQLSPQEAESLLLPWLALAARAGAELPELYLDEALVYPFDPGGESTRVRRTSDEFASLAEIRGALAGARDEAIDRADGGLDPGRVDRAHRLQTLAIAYGAPPYRYRAPAPADRQKEPA